MKQQDYGRRERRSLGKTSEALKNIRGTEIGNKRC